MNIIIGSHVSFTKDTQLVGSVTEALSYNANALMLYTGAPQNTNRAIINDHLTIEGLNLLNEHHIDINHVIVHAPYIINLGNNVGDNNAFAITFLKQEVTRVASLGLKYLVLHPGSFVKLTREQGLTNIVNALNTALIDDLGVMILLETMAGKGTEVGINFEEVKYIINHVNKPHLIGVCLDTCHLHDGGYDISDIDGILNEFDRLIGIDKIKCIHLNDSKNERGAHKDRHENIGLGFIGFDNIMKVVNHPLLENIPKILETPYVKSETGAYPPYKFEISMIRSGVFNPHLINDIIKHYEA